ncbi:MAG TPA: cytochrome P450 [Myxococcales bacterium]|nr:cytochrome P450 [Myxococcales bacterium]HIK84066.1 cytochrome P450 [Myxococcales bacterium]
MNDVDLDHFRPQSDEIQQYPFDYYEAMRSERPVMKLAGEEVGRPGDEVYCVSRHEDVHSVLLDHETYSSRFGSTGSVPEPALQEQLEAISATGWAHVDTMLTEDPPVHTRYRKLVSKAFTPKMISSLEPRVRALCENLVNGWKGEQRVDFNRDFGVPLPVTTVAYILDVPDDHQSDFKRWADQSVAAIGRTISDDERLESQRTIVEQQRWFADQIELRRNDPSDDFLSNLLNARLTEEDEIEGDPLSMGEMLSIIRQIQVAGSETTTSLLADAMVRLSHRPEIWGKMKEDPTFIQAVVEEGLRLSSPNQGLFRIATRDAEIRGVAIPKGSAVWAMFGSANRDERVFPNPDEFDPDRKNLHDHLALGKGVHYCLGAALARLEARVGLEVLCQRIDSFSVVDEASLRYSPSFILRGIEGLKLDVEYC